MKKKILWIVSLIALIPVAIYTTSFIMERVRNPYGISEQPTTEVKDLIIPEMKGYNGQNKYIVIIDADAKDKNIHEVLEQMDAKADFQENSLGMKYAVIRFEKEPFDFKKKNILKKLKEHELLQEYQIIYF